MIYTLGSDLLTSDADKYTSLISNLAVLILLILTISFLISGLMRGFLRGAVVNVSLVLCVLIGPILNKVVKAILVQTGVYRFFYQVLSESFESIEGFRKIAEPVLNSIPEFVRYGMNDYGDIGFVYATDLILRLMVYVITFIFIRIITGIVFESISFLEQNKIIGKIDKLFGAVCGVVKALLITWGLMLIVGIVSNLTGTQVFMDIIDASNLLHFLYQHNPLLLMQ